MISICILASTCIIEQKVRNSIQDLSLVPYMMAMAKKESNFNPKAIGKVGELGLFQVKPSTAKWIGCTNHASQLFDIRINTMCAEKYIVYLRNKTGNIYDALRAYNEGPNKKYRYSSKRHKYVKMILKEIDRQAAVVNYK